MKIQAIIFMHVIIAMHVFGLEKPLNNHRPMHRLSIQAVVKRDKSSLNNRNQRHIFWKNY
ncbi:hypothetical protein RchiOBHm_Chr4g0413151 [Rosa chinensis]|uniref:Uncharacterized protein n=1 Tax=Rosa chinensis TaxID=74649 RepID=A0A2P6QW18_ROSCH|nr:hypothetical protein RchiOBHm_Chr4g0413151 [Rosa chinensis]